MSDRHLRGAVAALAAIGAGLAAYLTYVRYADATIVCATGGCETVQRSDFAVLAGVPVAVLGLGAYLVLLATSLSKSDFTRMTGAVVAVSGVLFAVYLLYTQIILIDAVCQWCVASDGLIALLAVASVLRLRSGQSDDPTAGVEVHPLRR
jgi:uncharacterized membrane protein